MGNARGREKKEMYCKGKRERIKKRGNKFGMNN